MSEFIEQGCILPIMNSMIFLFDFFSKWRSYPLIVSALAEVLATWLLGQANRFCLVCVFAHQADMLQQQHFFKLK